MAVCYRHPGRETSVACSNCGKPICTDCMTPTSVGMRCPECAGQRTRVRRVTPGLARANAPATYTLIALNAAVFVAQLGSGGSTAALGTGGRLIRDGGLSGPQVAN